MGKRETPLQKMQPRFGTGGRLFCAACWAKYNKQSALSGSPGDLTCVRCGTNYVQKPMGMSFTVNLPPAFAAEAREAQRVKFAADRAAAKSEKESNDVPV